MRTCTLRAPASFSIWISRAMVVPLTIESSTSTRRFPATADFSTDSFILTLLTRSSWVV